MRVYDEDEAIELNAEPWQSELLKLNPSYVHWGPREDYMMNKDGGWSAPCFVESWDDFKESWKLDELNECVNFYFEVARENAECVDCAGSGYAPEAKKLYDDWYDFERTGRRWADKLTQADVDALYESGRLSDFKEKPTADEVNIWSRSGMGHDCINRMICIESRSKQNGHIVQCTKCNESGRVYTKQESTVNLVVWMLHPRKGCSRGVEVQNITQKDLPSIKEYLREAAKRNQSRFESIMEE